jgi:hypothetical protein
LLPVLESNRASPAKYLFPQLDKKSRLNRQLKEVEMNCEEEIMEGYFKGGSQEIGELT